MSNIEVLICLRKCAICMACKSHKYDHTIDMTIMTYYFVLEVFNSKIKGHCKV